MHYTLGLEETDSSTSSIIVRDLFLRLEQGHVEVIQGNIEEVHGRIEVNPDHIGAVFTDLMQQILEFEDPEKVLVSSTKVVSGPFSMEFDVQRGTIYPSIGIRLTCEATETVQFDYRFFISCAETRGDQRTLLSRSWLNVYIDGAYMSYSDHLIREKLIAPSKLFDEILMDVYMKTFRMPIVHFFSVGVGEERFITSMEERGFRLTEQDRMRTYEKAYALGET